MFARYPNKFPLQKCHCITCSSIKQNMFWSFFDVRNSGDMCFDGRWLVEELSWRQQLRDHLCAGWPKHCVPDALELTSKCGLMRSIAIDICNNPCLIYVGIRCYILYSLTLSFYEVKWWSTVKICERSTSFSVRLTPTVIQWSLSKNNSNFFLLFL